MSNCPYTTPDLRFAKLDSNLYAVENLVHKTRRLGNLAILGEKQQIFQRLMLRGPSNICLILADL